MGQGEIVLRQNSLRIKLDSISYECKKISNLKTEK